MPLNSVDIQQLGNTTHNALTALIGANGDTTIELGRTNLNQRNYTIGQLATDFGNSIAPSVNTFTTTPMDDIIYDIRKASFPVQFRRWLLDFIDASDSLNVQQVVDNAGRPIPMNIFRQTELANFFTISKYACADAGNFPGNIQNGSDYYYQSQVINRVYRANQDTVRYQADQNARQLAPSEISAMSTSREYVDMANSIAKLVTVARAGICFTLAWAAAAPLLTRMWRGQSGAAVHNPTLTRLEIVSRSNHVFMVINRGGASLQPGDPLPPPNTWGPGVVEVDTWLGTLGWGYAFVGVNNPENQRYLTNLSSHFDSDNHNWRGV